MGKVKTKKLDKRSVAYLVSALLTTAYIIYMIVYWVGVLDSSKTDAQIIGRGIGAMLVMPHLILVGIAYIFNWIAYGLKENWGGLVAGILYAVSMFFMLIYTPFVLIQMILCFVAYARTKKRREQLKLEQLQATMQPMQPVQPIQTAQTVETIETK